MRSMRRCCRIAVLAAAFARLLAAQPAAAQEVKLNEVLRSLFYAPQYVAVRSGAFEQEGLKIVGPKTTWGVQAAVTEVVSGNSNIALMGPEAAGLTQEASPDRRLVNFALLTNGDGGFILSKTPMPNFTIADLKGKTIVTAGQGLDAGTRARRPHQEGGARSQQGRDHPQHPGLGEYHPVLSRAEHELRAGVRADGGSGGGGEQGISRRLGRRAGRADAVYRLHGAGELHREKPRHHPGLHQRGLQGTDLDRHAFAGGDRRADRAGLQGRAGRND